MRTLLVVLADDLTTTAGTLKLYTAQGVRTVVHSQNENVRNQAAELGVTHVETEDPYDLIEKYEPQVVVCDYNGPLRATKLAVYRTGIPQKLYLTATEGATSISVGASADQKQWEHYFRDLDRTNAPLPETDLFAGL
ncbi:hypothetical protein ACFWNN_30035 [Lentzea sp. NPDC058450]|uniref:hypothetical protein n=1 Tax=Lentzea sp. NPDC058450 TaxID=3346505 RepID=UPI0036688CE8